VPILLRHLIDIVLYDRLKCLKTQQAMSFETPKVFQVLHPSTLLKIIHLIHCHIKTFPMCNALLIILGGERSFSTLCFALALHEMTEAPFRAMDEFDVFMVLCPFKNSLFYELYVGMRLTFLTF